METCHVWWRNDIRHACEGDHREGMHHCFVCGETEPILQAEETMAWAKHQPCSFQWSTSDTGSMQNHTCIGDHRNELHHCQACIRTYPTGKEQPMSTTPNDTPEVDSFTADDSARISQEIDGMTAAIGMTASRFVSLIADVFGADAKDLDEYIKKTNRLLQSAVTPRDTREYRKIVLANQLARNLARFYRKTSEAANANPDYRKFTEKMDDLKKAAEGGSVIDFLIGIVELDDLAF